MAFKRSFKVFLLGLALTGTLAAFDIPFLWLEGPSGRDNPHDPKSPLFAPTLAPTAIPATPTYTRTITATWTISPTFTDSPTASLTPSGTETSTATPTATPSATPTSTVTPTFTATPSVTETSTDSPTSTATPSATPTDSPSPTYSDSPTATPTATDTPSPTVTVTPSATPTFTPTPVKYDDFDTGLNGGWTYGDTGSSITFATDNTDFVSGPSSLKLQVTSVGWGAGFTCLSNYYNGSGVIDATGMLSASFQIKTDKNLYFSVRFDEGSPAEAGGDLESWESRWYYVPAGAAWQSVSLNLYQFEENLYDGDCNPLYLAPPASPCATADNNSLDKQSIKGFQIQFAAVSGLANVYLDDVQFNPALLPHNGDWPVLQNFGLNSVTSLFNGFSGGSTDRQDLPCPASSSTYGGTWQSSGGWDGGPYGAFTYTVDPTPNCGFAYAQIWLWLGRNYDASGYTGLRFRHREDNAGQTLGIYVMTPQDACVPGWNNASVNVMSATSWTTATLPFSSFTDGDPCAYVGSGNLSQIEYVVLYLFTPGSHTLDLDDVEIY